MTMIINYIGKITVHLHINEPFHETMVLLSSVNSFFKRACAAIQWGWMSDFWSDSSSTSILAKALARLLDCTGSPEPSLVAYAISAIISGTGSNMHVCFERILIYCSVIFQKTISKTLP